MSPRRIAALALSGALLAGGTGAAIAAVGKDEHKKSEQAILDDAAKRLDVTPEKLRDALSAAQEAQLDEAVKAGKLTQKQADEIKEQSKKAGGVLGARRFLGGPACICASARTRSRAARRPRLLQGGRHGALGDFP